MSFSPTGVSSSRDLFPGKLLLADDLCLLRPGDGIAPFEIDLVVGRVLKRPIPAGTTRIEHSRNKLFRVRLPT